MILRVAVLAAAAGAALGLPCAGRLPIGGAQPAYLVGTGGRLSGGNVTLEHNSALALGKTCQENSAQGAYGFTRLQLLGRTLSFTVDLSRVSCSCSVALYLVKAPPRGPDGAPSKGSCSWDPYYCDASGVCGQWCPEVDLMEANNLVFSSTPHRCDPPSPKGRYGSCDHVGCGRSTRQLAENAYGPGRTYRIDTMRPFEVLVSFHGSSGSPSDPAGATFTGMETRLRQGSSEIVLDFSTCGSYLSSLAQTMAEGMSLRLTYWGGSASAARWLDGSRCGESCGGALAGEATISNLHISGACPRQLSIGGLEGGAYVQGFNGSTAGQSLVLKHNSGLSVADTCDGGWNPNSLKIFRLLGKTLSFNVDLSRVGCACNVALYLIRGPARDWSGNPSAGSCPRSPYYCDANRVCGQWCPEVDIMEANNDVYQTTPHRCDQPSGTGHYSNCDRKGCVQSTKAMMGSAYGPGAEYMIDTRRPFAVRATFHGSGARPTPIFTGMTVRLQQDGRELVFDGSSCQGYVDSLAEAMAEGMSMRITYWGKDAKLMGWMDQPPCGMQSCSGANAGDAVISDIMVLGGDVDGQELQVRRGPAQLGAGPSQPLAAGSSPWQQQQQPPPPAQAEGGTPWWVYMFVGAFVLQCGLIMLLGALTMRLQSLQSLQPSRLLGTASPSPSPSPWRRGPLDSGPTPLHPMQPLRFESLGSLGSSMAATTRAIALPVSPVRTSEV